MSDEETVAKETATDSKSAIRWYVVHAYSGFEAYVKKVLESRIAMSGYKDKFGQILIPTEEVVEMKEGTKRKSERKFFPGYVLVQMEMNDDTWHLVKQVPKVLGFIGGTSDKPAPITEEEANSILSRVEEGVDTGSLPARAGSTSALAGKPPVAPVSTLLLPIVAPSS